MNRKENMAYIRRRYYEKYDSDTKRAWRSAGGKSNVNRPKFDTKTASEAAKKRWASKPKEATQENIDNVD